MTAKLRNCDIVMKGGVASGIVYPQAISTLAKTYRFRSIGGTSAGAIAAAAAAAAEYRRRQTGSEEGFTRLGALPRELGANPQGGRPHMLSALFQPMPALRRAFDTLLVLLDRSPQARHPIVRLAALYPWAVWWAIALPLVLLAPLMRNGLAGDWAPLVAALLGGSIGVAVLLRGALRALETMRSGLYAWPGVLPAVLLAAAAGAAARLWQVPEDASFLEGAGLGLYGLAALICGGFTVLAWGGAGTFARELLEHLPRNGFGLCSGKGRQDGIAQAPLTEWLAGYIDELAGVTTGDHPLTFGDLLGSNPALADDPDAIAPPIELLMFTTCVTHGRPYRLPFSRAEAADLYFCPNELGSYFPERVVQHLKETAGPALERHGMPAGKALLRMPNPESLPVVFATRLSLSFPALLSALPLYAPDYTLPGAPLKKVWFSDGGICSNFPVHLFDSPIPAWPTFAINLKKPHPNPDYDKVWVLNTRDEGRSEAWSRFFDEARPVSNLAGFAAAIIDSMQNWRDRSQARSYGFRDRIAHVSLQDDEGGLNLNMDDKAILRVAERGARAAQGLSEVFGRAFDPRDFTNLNWHYHRAMRMRIFMGAVQEKLARFGRGYRGLQSEGGPGLGEMLRNLRVEHPLQTAQFYIDERQIKAMEDAAAALAELADAWAAVDAADAGYAYKKAAPQPEAVLRLVPDI